MAFKIPTVKFNNGLRIPALGLGTWKSKPGQVVTAVKDAIDLGYRHIDCALLYENEHEIGKAIDYKIAKKVVRREDLFITGKLWNTFHRPDLVEGAIKQSLCDLRTNYLDLYLMHWPMAYQSKPGQVVTAVKDAIDLGYRHIDCALLYENEHEIGKAIDYKIAKKVVRREDLFITGKLWNTFHRPDLVEGAIKQSLCDLRTNYLDLYLMHWPMAYQEGPDLIPMSQGKVLYSDVDYVDTWKVMEELVKKCYVKSIGLANFNKRQIERIFKCASIAPVANQVECHPYLNQRKLMDFCRSKQIVIICYSPLGSPDRPWAKKGEPALLEDKKLKTLSKTYNKTPAQIVLRYQIERGNVVIPKSVTKARIQQNMEIFDFQLSSSDIAVLDSLNIQQRFVHLRGDSGHPYHPFVNDEY